MASISAVDILINFWLSKEFSILISTFLTILAVLFTCIYTIRTSAENSMHNANANFSANKTDKGIREIWRQDCLKWRGLCAINTKIATMFLYSFILLAITFFITLIVPFFIILIVHIIKISLKLEIGLCNISRIVFIIIIFLTLLSIINLLRGFLCYIPRYLFSWVNVPGNDSERLLRSLRDDLDVGWAENAEIRKSDDGKTIHIFKDEYSAEIMIDDKKEKATIKISDGRTHELNVKKKDDKLNIYKSNRELYLSKEKSWLTMVSHRLFNTDLLSYECPLRNSKSQQKEAHIKLYNQK